jgi:hypothetical protein
MASTSTKMSVDVSKFETSYEGIGEMIRSEDIREALTPRAEKVLAQAKANAPVVTGEYEQGLHIEQSTTDRVVISVKGSSDHDNEVEAATGNLARALDAAR